MLGGSVHLVRSCSCAGITSMTRSPPKAATSPGGIYRRTRSSLKAAEAVAQQIQVAADALHAAADRASVEGVQEARRAGTPVTATNQDDTTALYWAVRNGHVEVGDAALAGTHATAYATLAGHAVASAGTPA